jgi:pyruvate/2-oxoglutarate dehydrogenase complex dihydrolipoamide acyltransferase (E2) component
MPSVPDHVISEWPLIRNAVVSTISLHRPYTMFGMVEADITSAWERMAELRRQHRIAVAPHAYYLYCVAQVTSLFPQLNTYRKGRRHLVTFGDIDIGTTAEKTDPQSGEKYAAGFVVRAAQKKSLADINDEMRQALRRDPAEDPGAAMRRKFAKLPGVVRWFIRRRIAADPFRFRQVYGTVGLTNVHLAGVGHPYFAIPPNPYTMTVALGGAITRNVVDDDGRVRKRRMLPVTMAIDHALVDGIMACRFGRALIRKLESGDGLGEAFAARTREMCAGGR